MRSPSYVKLLCLLWMLWRSCAIQFLIFLSVFGDASCWNHFFDPTFPNTEITWRIPVLTELALSWWPSTKSTWQAERLRTFRQNQSQASRSAGVFSFKISDFRIFWFLFSSDCQRRKREPFSHRPAKCASWKTVWWGDETLNRTDALEPTLSTPHFKLCAGKPWRARSGNNLVPTWLDPTCLHLKALRLQVNLKKHFTWLEVCFCGVRQGPQACYPGWNDCPWIHGINGDQCDWNMQAARADNLHQAYIKMEKTFDRTAASQQVLFSRLLEGFSILTPNSKAVVNRSASISRLRFGLVLMHT